MLVLASASPRRQALMKLICETFAVEAADVDETLSPELPPCESVQALARKKALCIAESRPGDTVIGADTIVVLNGEILGKPRDADDAKRMLSALSGREHEVLTGVCIVRGGRPECFFCRTLVRFRPLSLEEIDAYVACGEPMDKAGAYGIQGKGALFVSEIHGDYPNVVGLPVCLLSQTLGMANFSPGAEKSC